MPLQDGRAQRALHIALVALALVGAGLRIAAFRWNADLLHGDVNLHALAAREYAEHGRLHYPMKFDFREEVDYGALTTPAVLHPRGTPFIAGLLTRVSGLDAYTALRLISLAAGLALLAVALALAFALRHRELRLPVGATFAALACAPLPVDVSGNGSPYAGAALATALAGWWLGYGPRLSRWHGILFGLLAGLAAELHGTMVALPVAFVAFRIARRQELGWRGLPGFAFAFLLARAPSYAWTWSEFGSPFYPLSSWIRGYRFGLVDITVVDGHVVHHTLPWSELSLGRYAREVIGSAFALVRGAVVEASPFVWPLVALGLTRLRTDARVRAALLPFTAFLTITLAWGMHEQRFLVVLLPAVFALAGIGLARIGTSRALRSLAGTCILGMLAWFGAGLMRNPPSRYYAWEATFVERYPAVRALALEFAREEPGVVIGFDRTALGALYWHRHPYVDAPWAGDEHVLQLVRDFDVRYVWAPAEREPSLRERLSVERVVVRDENLVVLELERAR